MDKELPLWQAIYYSPAYTEVAKIVGYAGTTYRELMEKVEPLKKQFGGQAVDSAIFRLATFEGDTTCNVKPLAHVRLRAEARKACFQLLGFPPEHKEVTSAEMLGLDRPAKPTPSKAASKPKPKKEPKAVEPRKVKTTPVKKPLTPKPPTGKAEESKSTPKATVIPIMQQYRDAKERHPDMILLFRMGDFYEMFEKDAELASKVLGLTLTTRDRELSMAGFPHHQLETYLHKLLHAGHRVAVCDQVEENQEKGPIHQEVQRVVVSEEGDSTNE